MITFAYPYLLFLLLLIPFVGILYILARVARNKNLKKFGNIKTLRPLMPLVSPYKPHIQITLELLAIIFLVLALARPWGGVKDETTEKEGIEVMLAVDASNSMLAPVGTSENGPDRMRTAKLILEKIINRLDNDRVGLIVYAGGAYTLVPVTSDYVSAKMFLNSIDPSQISNQGTNIAEAISLATSSFTDDKNIGKAIILITDAEELEDKENVMSAVKMAAKNRIQVDVVGVGGTSPVKIPMNNYYVIDPETDQPVMTTLNEELATEIAKSGKGIYVNASNAGAVNELEKQLDTVKKTALETNTFAVHDELYALFGWLALICLILRIFILDRKISWLDKFTFFSKTTIVVAIVTLAGFSPLSGFAENSVTSTRKERQLITQGNKLYKEADYSKAASFYEKALKENHESAVALYNWGLTKVQRSKSVTSDSLKNTLIQSAIKDFSAVGQSGAQKADLASKAFYNLGNIAFNSNDLSSAIQNYKQSLRYNPFNNDARRNLRICQLKQQENKNNDQQKNQENKDNQDKQDNQEKKDNEQKENNDQNQDQDQQKQNKDKINRQTADQILRAMENKENATRARMAGRGDKSSGQNASRKKW